MSRPGPPRWFAPSSIPPILLLTVVTSFAFNHALISTQRKQDLRDHRIRTTLLHDTIDYNARLLLHLSPPSTSTSSWFTASTRAPVTEEAEWIAEEREALLRRWKAVGLDPVSRGLMSRLSGGASAVEEESGEEARKVGPRDVTWSEIFLGSKESRSTLTQRWHKVTAGIKDSFSQLNLSSSKTPEAHSKEGDEEELQQLSQLWSEFSKSS
ncbi:uncharacterized protein SRS1_15258 [Sporisorium reilianum f. sp. reilianum]|uniref:Uncharacterized protein n=1 Tax=Sporisorium reilianum f. sp. reilianum TaxID=72559 RepID=A0A2N8UJ67_9BASI|nr:uncharacterized protein SRS1_15258 [Sporisorium reilianum f. sp. reilianum]